MEDDEAMQHRREKFNHVTRSKSPEWGGFCSPPLSFASFRRLPADRY
jgi:hypothetical protein